MKTKTKRRKSRRKKLYADKATIAQRCFLVAATVTFTLLAIVMLG